MKYDDFPYYLKYNNEEIQCHVFRWDDTLRAKCKYKNILVECTCSYKKYLGDMSIIEAMIRKHLKTIDEKGKDFYQHYKLKELIEILKG
ncbi:hypothetical protein [Clostridium sp.]|jgi:5-methylcytosine-specific restriction endonuclease McrA|uniref:hypothetical protein n=1 Tax=Clostridium sp. TaxID=1506 RepID=UPI002FDDA230